MVFLGKALLRPPGDATADKKKPCNADSNARYKTREEERDAEGEKYRPRRACRHPYRLSLTLFIHDKSPSDQVYDCKHHDPHGIHEVPIKSNNSEALTLPRVNPAEKREDEDRGKKKQPDYDVGGV